MAFDDERTVRLAKLLEERMPASNFLRCGPRIVATGLVASIRDWIVGHAPDGRVAHFRPEFIAETIEWPGNPQEMIWLLQDAGYLDEHGYFIDWEEMVASSAGFRSWIEAMNEEDD